MIPKPIDRLTAADMATFPVWQFADARGRSNGVLVRPLRRLPANNLAGRIVATRITLADRRTRWALIGNVDVADARLTKHFLTLSVYDRRRWFTLAVIMMLMPLAAGQKHWRLFSVYSLPPCSPFVTICAHIASATRAHSAAPSIGNPRNA